MNIAAVYNSDACYPSNDTMSDAAIPEPDRSTRIDCVRKIFDDIVKIDARARQCSYLQKYLLDNEKLHRVAIGVEKIFYNSYQKCWNTETQMTYEVVYQHMRQQLNEGMLEADPKLPNWTGFLTSEFSGVISAEADKVPVTRGEGINIDGKEEATTTNGQQPRDEYDPNSPPMPGLRATSAAANNVQADAVKRFKKSSLSWTISFGVQTTEFTYLGLPTPMTVTALLHSFPDSDLSMALATWFLTKLWSTR